MELEKSLLNSLTNPSNIKKAWEEGLRREHFELKENKGIFDFIIDYWSGSPERPAPTVEVLLEEYPAFKVGDPEESLTWLINKAKHRFVRNQIQTINEEVALLNDSGKSQEALKTLTDRSFEVAQNVTDRRSVSQMADPESIAQRRARYNERAQFKGMVQGAPLGFAEIDQHTYGMAPGELGFVAGASGTGKSFFLGQSALAASAAGFRPYLVTMELSTREFEDRLDAILSGVSYTKLYKGELDHDELDRLKAAQEDRAKLPFLIVDHPSDEDRGVQSLVTKALQSGANYLLIDQLSFVRPRKERYNTLRDQYGEIVNDFKVKISEDGQAIPCLVASQFNRAQRSAKNRGGMENLAEASFIENVADWVFGLTQTNEMKVNSAMAFDIMKPRRVEAKSWLLNWRLKNKTLFTVDQEIPREQ